MRPDLVLLDIGLPDLDGIETLKLIRQQYDMPVLMVTADGQMASLQKALDLGADDYIKKPFRDSVLVARIQSKLRRYVKNAD